MSLPIVNSFNEWDPLEEVIVGVLDGACQPLWERAVEALLKEEDEEVRQYYKKRSGQPMALDAEQHAAAQQELDEFVHILEAEGVKVRRPEPINWAKPYSTPDWTSPGGRAQTCPRDVLVVIGNEIIEAPMSRRGRYFEFLPYRKLIKEYFQQGAKWTAAPKPQMHDELYDENYTPGYQRYVTTEYEPVFDAADIARCGKDLFVQRSHVTNRFGFEWLQRHLGDTYNLHLVEFNDKRAVHIDATFIPLAPGKLMINPDRPIKQMPDIFEKAGWDILVPPKSTYTKTSRFSGNFQWYSINVLMLDEQRIIVEKHEEPFIHALKDWGFKPIPCAFRNCYNYGGSFHCFTCDIRRRGELQSYF
jgi:glycine amidinotransferase